MKIIRTFWTSSRFRRFYALDVTNYCSACKAGSSLLLRSAESGVYEKNELLRYMEEGEQTVLDE